MVIRLRQKRDDRCAIQRLERARPCCCDGHALCALRRNTRKADGRGQLKLERHCARPSKPRHGRRAGDRSADDSRNVANTSHHLTRIRLHRAVYFLPHREQVREKADFRQAAFSTARRPGVRFTAWDWAKRAAGCRWHLRCHLRCHPRFRCLRVRRDGRGRRRPTRGRGGGGWGRRVCAG